MVLSRNDKRKRKEGDLVDLMDPLAETPKRTKIHAQRKFAQGAITPIYSPVNTPIKEKEKPKPTVFTELITHKRPNTEDFLTFLCFRGTSILPPSLNFFSASPKKDKSQNEINSKSSTPSNPFSKTNGTCGKTPLPSKTDQTAAAPTPSKSEPASKEKVKNTPKKQAAAVIPKPIKLKTASTAIQALKKKYQEQRLAKQRLKKKFKPTAMKTRSCATVIEQPAEKPAVTKTVAPRRLLSRIESRRHGLRSTGLPDSEKKSLPIKPNIKKQLSVKLKKKVVAKDETSSVESFSVKTVLKKTVMSKPLQKKLFKKNKKIEVRRMTRSCADAPAKAASPAPTPANPTRRPTRKTKEAAAVYMEILGRKLVSPDLENEDNMSLDSFPELPNARKIAQTENEIKAKVKSLKAAALVNATASALAKEKEKKGSSASNSANSTKPVKRKIIKPTLPLKNKRLMKVQKYSEVNSDDDSVSSKESTEGVSTRRSASANLEKDRKLDSRSLRSSRNSLSRKSVSKATEQQQASSDIEKSTKTTESQSNAKSTSTKEATKETPKEKITAAAKRKREAEKEKETAGKKTETAKSKGKAAEVEEESEEETLGSILNKLKKKKEAEKEEAAKEAQAKKVLESKPAKTVTKTTTVETLKSQAASDPAKISDDEESFRGFTKKAISKVVNSCQSHVKANNLLDDVDSKLNILKTHEILSTSATGFKDTKNADIKIAMNAYTCIKPMPEQLLKTATNSVAAKASVKLEPDFEERKVSSTSNTPLNIMGMPKTLTHGRKERVNMSAAQIEKWLNESSLAKEESKVEMESVSNFKYDTTLHKPKNDAPLIPTHGHISISPKIQHLVRPVNVTLSKLSDRLKKASSALSANRMPSVYLTNTHVSSIKPQSPVITKLKATEITAPVSTPGKEKKDPSSTQPSRKMSKDSSLGEDHGTNDKQKPASAQSASGEAKGKSGQEVKKLSEPLNSPEEAQKDEEKSPPLLERTTPKNFELPKNFADLTNIQVLPLDKLTTSWSNVNCSASIAVQVNLDDQKQRQQQQNQQQSTTAESNNESSAGHRSTEISTQTDANTDNDDDDSGQLFYIPLQAVTRNAAQGGQQLIQGVAVKLGTEGPTGPNQRVLLKAKLVTKPPISVARCPPIGTVQPTARTPPNPSGDQVDVASTSSTDTPDAVLKSPSERGSKSASTEIKETEKTPTSEKTIKSPKSSIKDKKLIADNIKSGKKAQAKSKQPSYLPANKTIFPNTKDSADDVRLVEAPTFRPSEKDFQDPLEYIDKIRPIAEKFGICKVVPPSNFKPECKVSDDMRFTAYNHYVHRMLHRWGPNVKEMMAIKKYLATQSITLTQPPWIGGMEIDLPHLYQTVQSLGGLKEVIEKKKWQKVADGMKIPRSAQDRVTKLDDIYCKYLLPYDTLSQDEREKLFKEVEADWAKREKQERQETQSNDTEDEDDEDTSEEIEECIVKGRNMPLNAFYRIARNTQRMWFGDNQRAASETEGASAEEVETAFWRHVVEKKRHVCVHAASIDSSGRGFGFSVAKNSPFGRHPWNLKILTNNAGSVLRALGPIMGVTVPTLHVGMLFSACCWYRDPHGLPWIEYLHTGAKKIWYGIPDEQNNVFRKALTKMFPRYCKNKRIWLPSDTAMVPPEMLVSNGVPLCRTMQEPGQFIVVFPKAFTSSICTGYVVSESVYFAQLSWLETAEQVFQDIRDSCEPSIFSFERLLFSIINDSRSHIDVLKQILPTVIKVCNKEIENRKKLRELGLTNTEKLPLPESDKKGKGKKVKEEEGDYECDTCRANLFVSLVSNPTDESIFCLLHAVQYIEKKKQVLKNCTLMYTYNDSELNDLIHKLKNRIEAKSKKTYQTKQAK